MRGLLGDADLIAAEDTRRLRRLATALGVVLRARVVSCFDANEAARAGDVVSALAEGAAVLLVTDAGMPTVSDPGYRIVVAAAEAGFPVTVAPGPSAVTAALAVSGLASDRWCFEGFLPRKPGQRRARLAELATEVRTLVLFEAPHRLAATLADLAAAFGEDRPAVACRELTKTFEEIRRGRLGELAAWARPGVRGEVTLVVGGAPPPDPVVPDAADLAAEVAAREGVGEARRSAITAVALARRLPKSVVYGAVVAARSDRR